MIEPTLGCLKHLCGVRHEWFVGHRTGHGQQLRRRHMVGTVCEVAHTTVGIFLSILVARLITLDGAFQLVAVAEKSIEDKSLNLVVTCLKVESSLSPSVIIEKPIAIINIVNRELAAGKNGGETDTLVEHLVHELHICRVEACQVERPKSGAISEHARHVCHPGGIEVGNVDRGQKATFPEHVLHILHLGGIEVGEVERLKLVAF